MKLRCYKVLRNPITRILPVMYKTIPLFGPFLLKYNPQEIEAVYLSLICFQTDNAIARTASRRNQTKHPPLPLLLSFSLFCNLDSARKFHQQTGDGGQHR